MIPIQIKDDIRSVAELKRNTSKILKQIQNTRRPVFLTVKGRAEAVLLDAKEYDRISSALAMLKLLLPAEEDVKKDRIRDAASFFKEFKREKEIQG